MNNNELNIKYKNMLNKISKNNILNESTKEVKTFQNFNKFNEKYKNFNNYLINEGKVWDWIKNSSKKAANWSADTYRNIKRKVAK